MKGKTIGLVILIGVIAFVFRFMGSGSFMTADEPNWMIRSSEFWHKLFVNHDAGGTFITTHPGVVPMWLIGAGEFIQEQRLGIAVDTSTLSQFRRAATLPIVFATSLLIGLITFLVVKLWGRGAGILAGLLLALDPYLVGMSQVAHLDALLSLLLLAAVCAFLVSIKQWMGFYLYLSGILAGLAAATKFLPTVFFFLWVGGMVLWLTNGSLFDKLRATTRCVGTLLGVAALTFFLIWPALWVKTDIGNSVSRDAVTVTSVTHTELSDDGGQDTIAPASFYIRTVLGRSTPFVLILSIGVVVVLVKVLIKRQKDFKLTHLSVVWLLVYIVGFLLMTSLVAKKSDRYALPALTTLPILSAWICAGFWKMIASTRPHLLPRVKILFGIVLVLLFAQTILVMPYSISYSSSLFTGRPLSQQGWGEGLDAAGAWLNMQPQVNTLTVASWYPNVLGSYFHGTTYSLSSRNDPRVGYVVLYRNMLGRGSDEMATNVWDEYRDKVPAHVVTIGQLPYVWIFEQFDIPYFPKNVGELIQGVEIGQLLPITHNGWNTIEIGLSTFSGRAHDADVVLHVRENATSTTDIRTVRKTALEVIDSDWNSFTFEPIPDSAGKTYYISLTSSAGVTGDAVTVRYTDTDLKPGQMVWFKKQSDQRGAIEQFLRPGDIAYRIN